MKFIEYEKLANRTGNNELPVDFKLANYGMGISGEAGEVTDLLKKVVFHGHKPNNEKLKEELGDVLWYITLIASTVGMKLEDIAEFNIKKLEERYPNGFSQERSKTRESKK